MKREKKPPPRIRRVSPPGYWKDGESGQRKLILVIRQDRYKVDAEHNKLILKDFKIKISFADRLSGMGNKAD